MFAAKEIASDHKDLIHDVAFDFHGRRMATCSSDQTVKVINTNLQTIVVVCTVHFNLIYRPM